LDGIFDWRRANDIGQEVPVRIWAALLASVWLNTASAQSVVLRDQLQRTKVARVTQAGVRHLVPAPVLGVDEVLRSGADSTIAMPLATIASWSAGPARQEGRDWGRDRPGVLGW
jgi:hypothetical protein